MKTPKWYREKQKKDRKAGVFNISTDTAKGWIKVGSTPKKRLVAAERYAFMSNGTVDVEYMKAVEAKIKSMNKVKEEENEN